MSEMQDYKSSLADVNSRKFETFSYLPEMTKELIRKQVEYIVGKGWNPAVELTEPANAFDHFWYMWKLPLFCETNVDTILAEAEACHKAHPNYHVRLLGYDNYSQSKGCEMVVFRGKPVKRGRLSLASCAPGRAAARGF